MLQRILDRLGRDPGPLQGTIGRGAQAASHRRCPDWSSTRWHPAPSRRRPTAAAHHPARAGRAPPPRRRPRCRRRPRSPGRAGADPCAPRRSRAGTRPRRRAPPHRRRGSRAGRTGSPSSRSRSAVSTRLGRVRGEARPATDRSRRRRVPHASVPPAAARSAAPPYPGGSPGRRSRAGRCWRRARIGEDLPRALGESLEQRLRQASDLPLPRPASRYCRPNRSRSPSARAALYAAPTPSWAAYKSLGLDGQVRPRLVSTGAGIRGRTGDVDDHAVRVNIRITLTSCIVVEPPMIRSRGRCCSVPPAPVRTVMSPSAVTKLSARSTAARWAGLDRSALLGRAGHPQDGNRLPGGHSAVDARPVTRRHRAPAACLCPVGSPHTGHGKRPHRSPRRGARSSRPLLHHTPPPSER